MALKQQSHLAQDWGLPMDYFQATEQVLNELDKVEPTEFLSEVLNVFEKRRKRYKSFVSTIGPFQKDTSKIHIAKALGFKPELPITLNYNLETGELYLGEDDKWLFRGVTLSLLHEASLSYKASWGFIEGVASHKELAVSIIQHLKQSVEETARIVLTTNDNADLSMAIKAKHAPYYVRDRKHSAQYLCDLYTERDSNIEHRYPLWREDIGWALKETGSVRVIEHMLSRKVYDLMRSSKEIREAIEAKFDRLKKYSCQDYLVEMGELVDHDKIFSNLLGQPTCPHVTAEPVGLSGSFGVGQISVVTDGPYTDNLVFLLAYGYLRPSGQHHLLTTRELVRRFSSMLNGSIQVPITVLVSNLGDMEYFFGTALSEQVGGGVRYLEYAPNNVSFANIESLATFSENFENGVTIKVLLPNNPKLPRFSLERSEQALQNYIESAKKLAVAIQDDLNLSNEAVERLQGLKVEVQIVDEGEDLGPYIVSTN